jgi:signal transduction histidine kinase
MSPASIAGWVVVAAVCMGALVARHAWRARMEQIARACHELRGPITAVRLGLALSARAEELSPPRLQALDTELGRASLALEDLARQRPRRRISRSGSPRRAPHLESLDQVALDPLLEQAISAAAGRAELAGATITGGWRGARATVWGDRLRLAQALGNLLANAIEHGGGDVRVHGELRGRCARITVDDDGAGLPAPVAELARRPRGGRGARGRGLAITDSIARAHAGSVAAAPVGRGGRVVLTLPAREAAGVDSARRD